MCDCVGVYAHKDPPPLFPFEYVRELNQTWWPSEIPRYHSSHPVGLVARPSSYVLKHRSQARDTKTVVLSSVSALFPGSLPYANRTDTRETRMLCICWCIFQVCGWSRLLRVHNWGNIQNNIHVHSNISQHASKTCSKLVAVYSWDWKMVPLVGIINENQTHLWNHPWMLYKNCRRLGYQWLVSLRACRHPKSNSHLPWGFLWPNNEVSCTIKSAGVTQWK